MASQVPRKVPYLPMASEAYWEQLGVKRHRLPKKGLSSNW
jgi:hypothetical protein